MCNVITAEALKHISTINNFPQSLIALAFTGKYVCDLLEAVLNDKSICDVKMIDYS